jgi:hypothetical protein
MTEEELWIPVEGRVTTCRYQFRAGSALAFGVQLGEKFRITFDYRVDGQIYSDEFQSPVAVAQDEVVKLQYNPLHPEQNSLSRRDPQSAGKPPLLLIGIVGSLVMSLAWLAILRGCR